MRSPGFSSLGNRCDCWRGAGRRGGAGAVLCCWSSPQTGSPGLRGSSPPALPSVPSWGRRLSAATSGPRAGQLSWGSTPGSRSAVTENGREAGNGLGWEGPWRSAGSNPLPRAGTSPTSPGCSELHPAWPWTLPGREGRQRLANWLCSRGRCGAEPRCALCPAADSSGRVVRC